MRRIELRNLLPAGTVADRSTSDVLQELTAPSAGVANVPAAGDAGSRGAAISADALDSIPQGPSKDVAERLATLASDITGLNATQQTHIGATQDNTQALTQNTTAKNGPSLASSVGSVASNILAACA